MCSCTRGQLFKLSTLLSLLRVFPPVYFLPCVVRRFGHKCLLNEITELWTLPERCCQCCVHFIQNQKTTDVFLNAKTLIYLVLHSVTDSFRETGLEFRQASLERCSRHVHLGGDPQTEPLERFYLWAGLGTLGIPSVRPSCCLRWGPGGRPQTDTFFLFQFHSISSLEKAELESLHFNLHLWRTMDKHQLMEKYLLENFNLWRFRIPKHTDISPDSPITNWWTLALWMLTLFFIFSTQLLRPTSMIWSINETILPDYSCVFFLEQNISYRLCWSWHLSLFYFLSYNIRVTISFYMIFFI